MNKTKRKIFEASMKLFAEKGYDATSVEEITATVGVAKGTLYYHFSSKEEIFNFLIDEGVKLLLNNIEIKTKKLVIILQIRVLKKYESLIKIFLSQIWGDDPRSIRCKETVLNYIGEIEKIVKEGIEKKEIKDGDSNAIAAEIFALTCATMIVKLTRKEELDVKNLSKEFENILEGLKY